MIKRIKKNYFVLSVFLLLIVISAFVFISYAWFTQQENVHYNSQMGLVDVDINVFFEDAVLGQVPAQEVVIDESNNITKPGVYYVNITSNNADYFVEDLRISIDVNSSIDTYFRIIIFEQLTFIYTDISGNTNELSVLYEEAVQLNYDFTGWYDNRTFDNYLYYQNPVKRINETTPLTINLVDSYFANENYETRGPGYSLQLAFSIEAVQSVDGPENVWGLDTPPWGGVW
ncbi:MAG: hypothetical protein PF513_00120 [Tenericutes bacterium]|jgi:hypothetical protein|nr:hypothetical protein [Mycoplasmatota bacterium]